MDERLLTPADVAERCQISAKSVLRAIHRGQLRAYRLGERGAYRLREADIDAWLELSVVAVSLPAAADARVTVPANRPVTSGRLELTSAMGRSRSEGAISGRSAY